MSFGNWLWPSRRRQLFSATSASLKIMASAVLLERHPLERTVRWRMVANELSMTLVVRRCFDVHPNQITSWKAQLEDEAADVFGPGGGNGAAQPAVDVKSLHAKIGELTLENDFLEGALNKAGLLSAKR